MFINIHSSAFPCYTKRKLVSMLALVALLILSAPPVYAAPPNPRRFMDIYPGSASSIDWRNSIIINSTLYFRASDGIHGSELWRSDGTEAGTVLVKDIYPGPDSSAVLDFIDCNGMLFFRADDGIHGEEWWKSDGTEVGTVMVKDIYPGPGSSSLSGFTNVNGTLFFTIFVYYEDRRYELWKSDGTEAGTVMLKDVGEVGELINFNGTLYFGHIQDHRDESWKSGELWKSDGTAAGTVLVKIINWSIGWGGWHEHPRQFTIVDDELFFIAMQPDYGHELWKSDGTTAGTRLLKDIYPGTEGSYSYALTNVNGTLFFHADDGIHGSELWRSDGTEAGTVMVKDIFPGMTKDRWDSSKRPNNSWPYNLSNLNGTLFFGALTKAGRELWKSDGTEVGTVRVKDINPGALSAEPESLFNANGTLFFSAVYRNRYGRELWKSDGTKAGTKLVADIAPGSSSSSPGEFALLNNQLFFVADDGVHGQEWWVLDLTKPITGLAGETLIDAADVEVPEESISDAEAEAVYQAELAAYEAELAQAEDDVNVVNVEALPQKVFLPLIAR